MPYKKNKDLPKSITDNLPKEAQTLFRTVFNSAYEQYDEEETAFKVAWSVVKTKYRKNKQGIWEAIS